jgi:hypothetical protein
LVVNDFFEFCTKRILDGHGKTPDSIFKTLLSCPEQAASNIAALGRAVQGEQMR